MFHNDCVYRKNPILGGMVKSKEVTLEVLITKTPTELQALIDAQFKDTSAPSDPRLKKSITRMQFYSTKN